MAKRLRDKATVLCQREDIIPVPQSCLVLEKYWFGRKFAPVMSTNNPLAVEPETENDPRPAKLIFHLSFKLHFDCSGGSTDSDKDYLK